MLQKLSKRLSITGRKKADPGTAAHEDVGGKNGKGIELPTKIEEEDKEGQAVQTKEDGIGEGVQRTENSAPPPVVSTQSASVTQAAAQGKPTSEIVEGVTAASPSVPAAPRPVPVVATAPSTPSPASKGVFGRLLSSTTAKLPKSQSPPIERTFASRADKDAHYAALTLRTFIVGPSRLGSSGAATISKADMEKLRASLLKPDQANRIIAHLRTLPSHPDHEKLLTLSGQEVKGVAFPPTPALPIHAACLSVTDEQAVAQHFSKLYAIVPTDLPPSAQQGASPSEKGADESPQPTATRLAIPTLSPAALSSALKSLNLVSLVTATDMGIGHPVTDPGLFAGAVPSAVEIGDGLQELARSLLALGFAGSGMVWPTHTGVYPPVDRMSVYTYWWGYELVLPHPSVVYLSKSESVSGTLLNFLTVLSIFDAGVREILPFVRYIAQFVDLEFDGIQAQDQGQGVVCAATWVVPVALVPRPWDFAPRPTTTSSSPQPSVPQVGSSPTVPSTSAMPSVQVPSPGAGSSAPTLPPIAPIATPEPVTPPAAATDEQKTPIAFAQVSNGSTIAANI